MPARGNRTKNRRRNKYSARGKTRKKREQNKGTTPKFPIHAD
ncbi:MAG: hypothetical protein AB7P04_02925 [Bacteriovoracia bacterium]